MDQNPVKARLARLPARDAEAALATAGGDADLAAELFSALLTGLPGELDDLRGRLAESDWPGLAEHAHQLLGATRYCGVPALDEAAGALERAARIGAPDMIAAAFTNLEAEIERVRQATD